MTARELFRPVTQNLLEAGQIPTSIVSGDFNGDGRLDFAVASQGMNEVRVFTNRDGYNYVNAGSLYVPQTPIDLAAGKLDGDVLPDLVAVNYSSGNITLLLSGSSSATSPTPPPAKITLTVSTRQTVLSRLVDLRWTGTTSASVDIYRNGSRIATKSNTGSYTDQMNPAQRVCFATKSVPPAARHAPTKALSRSDDHLKTESQQHVTRRQRHKLFAIHHITDRRGIHTVVRREVPKPLAGACIERKDHAFRGSAENKVTRGSHDAAPRRRNHFVLPFDIA